MPRRTFNTPGHAHFLTCSCYRRLPLLDNPIACTLLGAALDAAKTAQRFELWAYVFMPNHIHLVIRPDDEVNSMSAILRSFKEPFARRYVKYLKQSDPNRLNLLQDHLGLYTFHRVWQRGGGFDRNLYSPEIVRRAIAYTEGNPVRKEFVESPELWRWSSARARAGFGDAPAVVDDIAALV